jgi:RES domain
MMSEFPPADARELQDIPEAMITGRLFRVHLAASEVQHFSNRSLYRFDPPPRRQKDFGTCYLATSREGAFYEALGGFQPLPEHLVAERVITEVSSLEYPFVIADLSLGLPGHRGLRSLYGGLPDQDYALSQEWAASLWEAGYTGIQYYARHAGLTELAVALWHDPAAVEREELFKSEDPEPLDDGLLASVESLFSVEIYPDAPLASDGRGPWPL